VCTAILYEDRMYVVDLGVGSLNKLAELGVQENGASNASMLSLRGIFFTHMHSDHCVDWPALYATGTMMASAATEPVRVFGPGRRDTLPRIFPPNRPEPPVVEPDDPAPGISGMTGYLRKAFAADFNDRARDSNFALPDDWYQVEDIDHSPYWSVDPEGIPPRLTAPIQLWEDGDVRITATLVDHRPTAPAYGFRFDTPDGSIVVSGDTAVSTNLIDLAQGADYLVHEVIDPAFADRLASILPPQIAGPVREHLLTSHTTIEQVGRDVAEVAGVKTLVLSHIVPADTPSADLQRAQDGFSGHLVIGRDLLTLPVISGGS
jgi:ribonuclease BN (tRNA processing enzyme)